MRAAMLLAGVALVLLIAVLVLQRPSRREAPVEPAPAPATVPEPAPAPPAPPPAESEETAQFPPGTSVVFSGATLELDRDSLPDGQPVRLALHLGRPDAGIEAQWGRVVAVGRDPLDLAESLDAAVPGFAQVAIDSTWLRPGRYIIEIRTNEKTHLPLHRYALEVR